MATLLEMAKDIIIAHASKTEMNKEELLTEISDVHSILSRLQKLEEATSTETENVSIDEEPATPKISLKKAFGKNKVVCLLCNKEMKTLSRHLKTAHDLTPKEYKEKFNIPKEQPLTARNYSESRREMAIARGLGDNLARARAARKTAKG